MDRMGRTPLHFALSNAGRKAAPAAVRLLLRLHKEIVNATGGGPLPLRVLSEYSTTVQKGDESQREAVLRCLELLLTSNPDPTADFFTTLQSLPDWLQERAVVMPLVQVLLNQKIAERFPTGVLVADFFVQLAVISFYAITVKEAIDQKFINGPADEYYMDMRYLIPLYLGAAYFFVRTLVQILSLLALKALHVWVYDPSNWLDVIYIFTVIFWATRMVHATGDEDRFRNGLAFSAVFLWLKLLAFLRNTYIDFAVFLGGLFYVVRRLVAFLCCLIITLIAFSSMFYTIYLSSDHCEDAPNNDMTDEELTIDLQCAENEIEVYCDRWSAFLNCFTMLLGKAVSS
jgi:hypothetical protein